ncbi:hypothetical protein TELCIR_13987, partial [Teladorsagia circumcincta]
MWILLVFVALLAPEVICLSCKPRAGGTPVPLGVFLTTRLPHSLDQRPFDAKPAIKLALNYIQNHSCILDGFKLELIYKDTQKQFACRTQTAQVGMPSNSVPRCKTSLGMKALFDLVASRPRPVALFGGMCTEVNEPVAMALKYWQVVQLSYAETHAKFGTADSQEWIPRQCRGEVDLPSGFPARGYDSWTYWLRVEPAPQPAKQVCGFDEKIKKLYPTFFRIVPGDRNLNNAKCRLINHFGWKKVGTLKQSDEPRHAL